MNNLERKTRDSPNRADLLDGNKRVYVYKNSRFGCWSIRQNDRVLIHTHYLCLHRPNFLVSEKGRQRLLKTKTLNIHAGITGYIGTRDEFWSRENCKGRDIIYNPFKMKTYKYADSYKDVTRIDGTVFLDVIGTTFSIRV